MAKVAIITGGARGIGLAVAQALAKNASWTFHIIDLNEKLGTKAASELGNKSQFHRADVTSYAAMASTFDTIFTQHKRLDLVFSSAGIIDNIDFFARHPAGGPPPEINQLTTDINYKASVATSYLAQHYFRKNPAEVKDPSLILVASCVGLYSVPVFPLYNASKFALVGFTRSIAKPSFTKDGFRVHVICPGIIDTDLYSKDQFDSSAFPAHWFTSIDTVAKVAGILANPQDMVDDKGKKVAVGDAWGLTVEISGDKFYFREQVPYSDQNMEAVMEGIINAPS